LGKGKNPLPAVKKILDTKNFRNPSNLEGRGLLSWRETHFYSEDKKEKPKNGLGGDCGIAGWGVNFVLL